MAFFNEFPHTRTYDSDLAWLIKRMKEVLSRMDSVEARMKALEDLVNDFINTLNIDEVIAQQLRDMIADGTLYAIVEELLKDYSKLTFQELALLFNPAALDLSNTTRIISRTDLTTDMIYTLPNNEALTSANGGNIHKIETNSAVIIAMSYFAGAFKTQAPTTSNNFSQLRTTQAFWTACGIPEGVFPFKISWNNGTILKEYISGQTHHAGFDAIAIPYTTNSSNIYGSPLAWYFDKSLITPTTP